MTRNRRPPTKLSRTNEHGVPAGLHARESDGARQYDAASPGRARPTEPASPAAEAELLDAATDRYVGLKKAGEACGYSADTMQRVVQRLKRRKGPVYDQLVRLKDDELMARLEDKLGAHLDYMTDELMAEANIGVLVKNFGILFDKLQLMHGRPTQIISVHERENMGKLLGLIVQEAGRRQIPIDLVRGEGASG